MRELVVYHAACRDGFAAAWAFHWMNPRAEFVEGFYGQAPPDVEGRQVYLLDFTYPRAVLKELADRALTLTILDHHKTAQADLQGFEAEHQNADVVFDMNRSGAGITWDEVNATLFPRPWVIDYVEDRDLWRWKLRNSRKVNAYLGTIPFTFEAWDALLEMPVEDAVDAGEAVQAKIDQYVSEVNKNARRIAFEGFAGVPIVNAPQADISELLDSLMEQTGESFAVGWWQRGDGLYQYSLRSRGDLDVSEIARRHGGGGHRNAAGFQVKELCHA